MARPKRKTEDAEPSTKRYCTRSSTKAGTSKSKKGTQKRGKTAPSPSSSKKCTSKCKSKKSKSKGKTSRRKKSNTKNSKRTKASRSPVVNSDASASSCSNSPTNTSDLGPVIKSPLDTHDYKVVQLDSNGLKGLLVSTCEHDLDLGPENGCTKNAPNPNIIFNKIKEFNEKFANVKVKTSTTCGDGKSKTCEGGSCKFSDATEKQKYMTKEWRKRKKLRKGPKMKCRRGVPDPDDEMQDARNNLCSVVLIIKAGMFHDPPDVQGMAHFCEHAIYLGSKDYPEVESFQKFVESHNGFSNARTDPESTTYMFNIHVDHIEAALDMFMDMIVNPIFGSIALAKEKELMSSEFEIKRLFEDHRYLALLQSCAVDGHPAANFGMGNEESLSKSNKSLEKLREWKNFHYTADRMLFALQGPYPVQELEKMLVKFGSRFPRKSNSTVTTSKYPKPEDFVGKQTFSMEKWNKLFHIVPVADKNFMYMSWALDPKFGEDHETRPITYMTYIMDQRTEGSLEWFLRKRGWILSLCITCPSFGFMCTKMHTIFSLTLELTKDGLENRLNIVRAVFSYINLLKEKRASWVMFDEIRQIYSDVFHYRSDRNLLDPTVGHFFDIYLCLDCLRELLESLLMTKSPGEVLLTRFLIRKYDPQLLDEFVDSLKPEKVIIIFASKSFEQEANEREPFYKIRYFKKPMCPGLITELNTIPPLFEFCFPKTNPFTKVSMCFPENGKERIENQSNLKIYKSPKGQVTYGNEQCRKGTFPTAQYTIWIFSPVIEDEGEQRCVPSLDIFLKMLVYTLDMELAQALNSLISYDVGRASGVLIIELRGPSPKLPQLAEIILRRIENFDKFVVETPSIFEDVKHNQIEIYNGELCDSESCAESLKSYLLVQRCLFNSDYAQFLTTAYRVEDFLKFVNEFKTRMYIRADLEGCVSRSNASQFAKVVDSMKYKPYVRKVENVMVNRIMQLPLGERCLLVSAKPEDNRTVFVLNHYQVGGNLDDSSWSLLNIIQEGIEDLAFEELRTRQQLGYVVESGIDDMFGVAGITIAVYGQADENTSGYINEKIDTFMSTVFNKFLSKQDAFNDSLKLYELPGERVKWKEANCFFREHFLPTGENFRKLSIQIQGHKQSKAEPQCPRYVDTKVKKYGSGIKLVRRGGSRSGGGISNLSHYLDLALKDVQEENGYFITNVCKFKNSLQCFGNVQSEDDFTSELSDM